MPTDTASSGLLASPATRRTTTETIRRVRATDPRAKAGPLERALGVPSIRMTAMIGTGAECHAHR